MRSRGMVKPYKDAKEQAFDESGLPDEQRDDYDAGVRRWSSIPATLRLRRTAHRRTRTGFVGSLQLHP